MTTGQTRKEDSIVIKDRGGVALISILNETIKL